jgi:TonB family protein
MTFNSVTYLLVLVLTASASFQAGGAASSPKASSPQTSDSEKKPQTLGSLEMLTPTEGVDFGPYLHGVFVAIRKQWFANMPDSVRNGEQGWNEVEICILQDGTVPKDGMEFSERSKKRDLDEATLKAVRLAAPYGKLPDQFTGPQIVLRLRFSYNIIPQK